MPALDNTLLGARVSNETSAHAETFYLKLLTPLQGAWFSRPMTHRNNRRQPVATTSPDAARARLPMLPAALAVLALVLVLVLITGFTGAGTGFA